MRNSTKWITLGGCGAVILAIVAVGHARRSTAPAGRGTPPAAQQAIKPAATIDSQVAATDAAEVEPVQLSNDTTGGPVGVHSVVAGDGTGVTVASPAGAGDTPGASYGIVKGPEGETADQAAARARALNARRANKGQ